MTRKALAYPFSVPLLLPAVFFSGAAALVYEIVWTRELSLVLGSTTGAVAAVLSAFMLGLALGAVLVGRRVDASRRPLRWAAFLEIGLGLYALGFPEIVDLVGGGFLGPWMSAFVVLLVPCALMGGTLPVLARAAADAPTRGAKALGALYGVNTLGAVAGALLATFVLLEHLGLRGATIFAASINLVLGAFFWVAATSAGDRAVGELDKEERRGLFGGADAGVIGAFFLAGFAGLALEVAWVRVLVYLLEGFTIAFGLMLATYLLGLGLGAVIGTGFASASRNPRRLLARILLLEAMLALLTFLYSDRLHAPLESMRSNLGSVDSTGSRYAFGLFFASAAVILPPTLLAGALLPTVARLTLNTSEEIGSQSGAVYAASTLGAVLAPPAAAFFLIPWLGVPGTVAASAGLLVVAGAIVAAGSGKRELLTASAVGVLFLAVCLLADLGKPLVEESSVLNNPRYPRQLIEFRDGEHCGVSVIEDLPSGTLSLYVDDFRAAETGPQYGYMRMLGHLPLLLHPNPERVLVIAFGTGTTAGSVSVHPEVKAIDCVEIEEVVFDLAHHFKEQNRGVLKDPRTTPFVADGREFVRRPQDPGYDVITLEPLMPYTPAAVYLYTQEFYETAAERLRQGGILCQWIPIHAASVQDFKRLLKSFTEAMPHVSLWFFEQSAVVLGSKKPLEVDFGRLVVRSGKNEAVANDLKYAFVGGPIQLLASHIASDDALRASLGDIEPMTDDRTVLEFRPLPRRFGKRSARYKAENLEYLRDTHTDQIPWLPAVVHQAGVDEAARNHGTVLASLAKEARHRLEGGSVVPSVELQKVIERDSSALLARRHYERRLYSELMAPDASGRPADAAAATELRFAPDRSAAFLELARDTSGGERRNLLVLALRENAMLPEEILRELANLLPAGPQRNYVQNRLNYLEGKPRVQGEQALAEPDLADLLPLLEDGDIEAARRARELARRAGERSLDRAESQAKAYLEEAEDKVQAAEILYAIESDHALAAALKVKMRGTKEELIRIAPLLCALAPSQWKELCESPFPQVRDAAAGAAAEHGTREHLETLAELCGDENRDVRGSAITSFRQIRREAEEIYSDYAKPPTAVQMEALRRLAQTVNVRGE